MGLGLVYPELVYCEFLEAVEGCGDACVSECPGAPVTEITSVVHSELVRMNFAFAVNCSLSTVNF